MKTLFRLFTSLALCALCLTACQDDEFMSMPLPSAPPSTSDTRAVNATSSLVQNADGTWTPTRRVPLVGQGRVVDEIANSLVSVLSNGSSIQNIVDTDLNNAASFGGGLLDAQLLANELVSVRDLNRTYAAGQTVGFTFKVADSGLLTANVLKGFWLQTFLNGEKQDEYGGDLEVEVLKLNLISVGNNNDIKEISFTTTKPFDEVKFNIRGISAQLLQSLSIYYAFVGDNPIKTATRGSVYFPNASLHENGLFDLGWTSMLNAEKVVDNDTTNYAYYGTFSEIFDNPCVTVRFDKEIPEGSEVGFEMSAVDLLTISIGGSTTLATYDDNNKEQDRMDLTSVVGLSAISIGRSRVSMITTKPCTQVYFKSGGLNITVGGTNVYYAYVRDAVQVDASSYFSLSDVTVTGTSYTLSSLAEGGTVSWALLSSVPGTSPQIVTDENGVTKIIGMMLDGDYLLSGTYTPTGSQNSITQQFTITRKITQQGESCNQMMTSSGEYGARVYMPQGGGSALTLDNIDGYENLIDNDKDNYATYNTFLSLAADRPIMGIELAEKIPASNTEPVRTGFTMQTRDLFLGADVLKCFYIKLYNGTTLVKETMAEGSNLADVGLIGDQSNKVRIGTTVSEPFDKIELWTAGLLNLNISEYRLYNAYWEFAEEECYTGQPTDACIEMLTPAAHGAEINYEETYIGLDKEVGSVAGVGNYILNLGNLLDEDKETAAELHYTNVIGAANIAIKFDEMPAGTQTGFIIECPNYLADISLLDGTIFEVCKDGTVQASTGEGGVLGLDVISFNQSKRIYVEITSNYAFDEIRLHLPGVAQVLQTTYVYGAYIRRDSDKDGIPDCAEDEENPTLPTESLTADVTNNQDICVGEDLTIIVTEGGTVGDTYELVCYNTSLHNETTVIEQALQESESDGTTTKYFTLSGLKAGEYFIRIQKEGKNVSNEALEAYVHPLQTTWKQSPANTDWNNWNNWTEGAPWTCTNVIIPGNCTDYPVLKADADNYCANLHISAGGEIVNTQYFTNYDYAWVELSMQPNTYYMLSAPLKDMVTGDMFVPESWNFGNSAKDYFTALTSITAPESRFTPRVYQRFWAREVPGKIISDGTLASEVIVSQTDWTAPFNAVAEAYDKGMGFSASITGAATFRFPKEHREYTYFDGAGNSTGQTEGVARNTQNVGRFWTDNWTSGDSFTVTATNLEAGETFVVGNPFMAHINIRQFLKTNPNITAVKLYDGNSIVTITNEEATETGYTHIEPMQSFYVTTKAASKELGVTFNAAMQEAKPGYQVMNAPAVQTRAETRGLTDNDNRNTLRLIATCDSRNTSCLVRLSPSADDAYRTGEDSRLLIDTQAEPTVAVFTVADGKALDIQQRRSDTDIPVGLRMKRRGRVTLTLSHRAGDDWTGWTLVDRQTGRRYPLTDGYTYIDLGTTGTTTNRLYLTKE